MFEEVGTSEFFIPGVTSVGTGWKGEGHVMAAFSCLEGCLLPQRRQVFLPCPYPLFPTSLLHSLPLPSATSLGQV